MSAKKVWVNLKENSRRLKCKVVLNKKKIWPMFWFFESISGNMPGDWVERSQRAGYGAGHTPGQPRNTDDQGVGRNSDFFVSNVGLEKFKVSVAKDRNGAKKLAEQVYEVWRGVHLSVSYMPRYVFWAFAPVVSEYEKYGILIKPFLAGQVDYQEVIENRKEALDLAPPVKHPGLEARVVFVDHLWPSMTDVLQVDNCAIRGVFTTAMLKKGTLIWPLGPVTDIVSAAQVKGPKLGIVDVRARIERDGYNLKWNFSGDPRIVKALAEGDTLRLRMRVKLVERLLAGTADGKNDGRFVVARRAWPPEQLKPDVWVQNTVMHEMGHAVTMVREWQDVYDAQGAFKDIKANPKHYAYYGNHCSTDATAVTDPPEKAKKGPFINGKCLMYGVVQQTLSPFCSNCKPYLRIVDLRFNKTPWAKK